jgi:hypothetical protein
MVGADFHPAIEIEPVGGETLDAGIESEIVALFFSGVFDQPIEKGGAESAGAVGVMRDQIVDVKGATGEKEIENPETADGANGAIELEVSELISFLLLLENARSEIDRFDVGSQLAHDRGTTADLLRRGGQGSFPGGRFRYRHKVSFLGAVLRSSE